MARAFLSLLALLSVLAIFAPLAEAACSTPGRWIQGRVRRYRWSDVARVNRGANEGWTFLPDGSAVCGATFKRDFKLNDKGLTLPLYISKDVVDSEVERVVIGTPTKPRDGWAYFTYLTNARNKAYGDNADVDKSKIVVIVPQFIVTADKDNGAAGPTDVIFRGLSWSSGENAYSRTANGQKLGGDQLSSFDMLDKIIEWANQQYPKATRHVLNGHSLGGQMINRYSVLRKAQAEPRRIDYVVANPGSWLWMTADRPRRTTGCSGFDDYKFGLEDGLPEYATGATDRTSMMGRLASRRVHVLLGSKDNGPGDTSCQAKTQGRTHLERGNNYVEHITKASGGKLPARWSVDYAPCSHVAECMYTSEAGIKHLILNGLPSRAKRVTRSVTGGAKHKNLLSRSLEHDAEEDEEEDD